MRLQGPAWFRTGRIRNTRYLLAAAAVIMSVLLLLSSFVTTLLIPESAYQAGGPASGRAIAYLAHELLGSVFGTIYDVSTIVILWFAGASAMAGLLHLIPRYLPRFGMAPRWVSFRRPMVLVLFIAAALVTVIFQADVEAQGAAYATGVLVLMFSGRWRLRWRCGRNVIACGRHTSGWSLQSLLSRWLTMSSNARMASSSPAFSSPW